MSDFYRLRIVATQGFDESHERDELLSIRLPGAGLAEDLENTYRWTAIRMLADHNIYAWQVRDQRVLTNVGASAELHEVVIFLAGAGAAAFTAELAKRLVAALEGLSKKVLGNEPEISDGDALAMATLSHREAGEYTHLVEFKRNEAGNRVFRFADGVEIEVDKYGTVVRHESCEPTAPA
jgi:hypothetical protein